MSKPADPDGRPAPLVPDEVDLRGFETMPLAVQMVRDSRFVSEVKPEAFRAGFLLWCAAWHQVPAGSVPDNDIELAKLAGYGFAVAQWKKLRKEALTNFVLCSDGRLYHREVSARALVAWQSRLEHFYQRARERLRKSDGKDAPFLTFEAWNARRLATGTPMERASAAAEDPGDSGGKPPTPPPPSGGGDRGIPPEKGCKGEGEGEGTERNSLRQDRRPSPTEQWPPPPDDDVPATWEAWRAWFDAEVGLEHDPYSVNDRRKLRPLAESWCAAGVTVGQMRAAIAKAREEATEPIAYLPAYVDRVLASMSAPRREPPKQRPQWRENQLTTAAVLTGSGAARRPARQAPPPAEEVIDG